MRRFQSCHPFVYALILLGTFLGICTASGEAAPVRRAHSAGPGFARMPIPGAPAVATLAAGRIGVALRLADAETPAAAFNSGGSWLWSTPVVLRVVRADGTLIA